MGPTGYRPPGPAEPTRLVGVMLIAFGLFVGLIAFIVWVFFSYSGYGASFAISLFAAGSLWMLVAGGARVAKKKLPVVAHLGILGVLTLILTGLGPTISGSIRVSEEKARFEELSKEGTLASEWVYRYQNDIPEQFHREEWKLEHANARVREAKSSKNAAELRKIVADCGDDELLEPAVKKSRKALGSMYDEGKAKLVAPKKAGAGGEFPVDEGLRAAFGVMLEDLAKASDANVYVSFENSAVLTEPKETPEILKMYRADPDVRAVFPKGDVPIIAEGSAFSPTFDQRRRNTFITAMAGSFAQVFDAQLLTLVPLEKGGAKKGKLVLEVTSKISRIPGFFMYEKDDRLAGLLFKIQVEWAFRVVDRSGKVIFEAPPTASEPAKNVSFSSDETDPDFAPYSIMMDSAYYNYSREVTGRFGLVPPPVKTTFVYTAN